MAFGVQTQFPLPGYGLYLFMPKTLFKMYSKLIRNDVCFQ